MTWAFGPLFPLFIAIYAASLGGIVWLGTSIAREGSDRFGAGFPRRAFAVLSVAIASLLSLMWAQRIALGLSGDLAGAGIHGETTMVVQALDLGLVVPTALVVATLVWRRSAAAYKMAAVYSVTAVAMSSAIMAMLVSAGIVTGDLQLPPIVIFGAFAFASALVTLRIYRRAYVDERALDVRSRHTGPDRLAARPARS